MNLLSPKPITVKDGDEKEITVIISKFPAVQGLEINTLYPASWFTSAIPKLGDYRITESMMLKLMNYVAVETAPGNLQRLSTIDLINNHLTDWEALVRTIWAIMEYNNSFFRNGTISSFFAGIARQTMAKVSEMLIQSSAPSSTPVKPPSPNSGQSTP